MNRKYLKSILAAAVASALFSTSCSPSNSVADSNLAGKAQNKKESFHQKLLNKAQKIDQAKQLMKAENQLVLDKLWKLDHAQMSMDVISGKLAWWAPSVTAKANKSVSSAAKIGITLWSIPSLFGGYSLMQANAYAASQTLSLATNAYVFLGGTVMTGAVISVAVGEAVVLGYQISSLANIGLLQNNYEKAEKEFDETEKEIQQVLSSMTSEKKKDLKNEMRTFMTRAGIRSVDIPSSFRSFGILKKLEVL